MGTIVIKHEFEKDGIDGVATVSEVAVDSVSFMEGLERTFRIKADERITGIEIVQKGNHTPAVRVHVAKR